MARIKTSTTRSTRHKKVLKLTRGYRMSRHRLFKVAHEALLHAGEYAFMGRKRRKRDFRRLWIIRLKAALGQQENPVSYSRFINLAKLKNINLNRKSLSQLAINYPKVFSDVFSFTTKK